MSEVKVSGAMCGRDRPTTGKNSGHPAQKPGMAAGGQKLGKMSWGGGAHHSEHKGRYVK